MCRRSAIGALLLAGIAGPLLAQSPDDGSSKTVRAVRTDTPVSIDGLLDELAWSNAVVVEDFYQVLPVEYAEPSHRRKRCASLGAARRQSST